MPEEKIGSFDGLYRFLSNFWPVKIPFEGITYPSVEHAYQAAKTLDVQLRHRIAVLPMPGQAKRMGGTLELRSNWGQLKFSYMELLLRYKFMNPMERKWLLRTGDAYLEEGNTHGDRIWGVCRGRGENHLGKLLMKIRSELATEK